MFGIILRLTNKGNRYIRYEHSSQIALQFLVNERCDETEQLFVDYYLNIEEPDDNMDIINSYWKKENHE